MESETDAEKVVLVPVHRCWGDNQAAVLVSYLAAHGIAAGMSTQIGHSMFPLTVDGLGAVEIVVQEGSADEARRLLASCEEDGTSRETDEGTIP